LTTRGWTTFRLAVHAFLVHAVLTVIIFHAVLTVITVHAVLVILATVVLVDLPVILDTQNCPNEIKSVSEVREVGGLTSGGGAALGIVHQVEHNELCEGLDLGPHSEDLHTTELGETPVDKGDGTKTKLGLVGGGPVVVSRCSAPCAHVVVTGGDVEDGDKSPQHDDFVHLLTLGLFSAVFVALASLVGPFTVGAAAVHAIPLTLAVLAVHTVHITFWWGAILNSVVAFGGGLGAVL
jgi:hypothetical protein